MDEHATTQHSLVRFCTSLLLVVLRKYYSNWNRSFCMGELCVEEVSSTTDGGWMNGSIAGSGASDTGPVDDKLQLVCFRSHQSSRECTQSVQAGWQSSSFFNLGNLLR
jgi:hypothetical protein